MYCEFKHDIYLIIGLFLEVNQIMIMGKKLSQIHLR